MDIIPLIIIFILSFNAVLVLIFTFKFFDFKSFNFKRKYINWIKYLKLSMQSKDLK